MTKSCNMIIHTDECTNSFRLVGFVNLHKVIPAFVYPVFFNSGNYYFQDGKSTKIQSFKLIDETSLPEIISGNFSNKFYHVGSETLYAFEPSANVIFGNRLEIIKFLMKYRRTIVDELLLNEINDFITKAILRDRS